MNLIKNGQENRSYLQTTLVQQLLPKRDAMAAFMRDAGFDPIVPQAGYFMLADFSNFGLSIIYDYHLFIFQMDRFVHRIVPAIRSIFDSFVGCVVKRSCRRRRFITKYSSISASRRDTAISFLFECEQAFRRKFCSHLFLQGNHLYIYSPINTITFVYFRKTRR
jgi:hypothetical protein